jgi:hypothetical protein
MNPFFECFVIPGSEPGKPNASCFGLIGDQTLQYPPPAEDMGAFPRHARPE